MTDAVDTAWKTHAALIDWTGKVDTKASFALTLESALLVGVVTLSSQGRIFHGIGGCAVVLYVSGIALLALSVLFAVAVVRPKLRSADLKSEAQTNYIYFGHLRHLTPAQVQTHLITSDPLPVLSRQLVEMSKIAWVKHRRVQLSMSFAPIGVLLLGICAMYA